MGHGWIQEYVSQWEADIPAPTPGPDACIDEPEGWFDIDGPDFNCLWYASDSDLCPGFGDSFTNGGLTANEACCACARVDSPDVIDGMGISGDGSFNVTFGYDGSYAAAAYGMDAANITSGVVADFGEEVHEFELSGVALFRAAIPPEAVANSGIDLDLVLYDPEGEFVDRSSRGGTNELVEVTFPANGTWSVVVEGYDTLGTSADYDLYSWVLSSMPGGTLELLEAPESATMNETETISFSWAGTAEDEWHLGAISHTTKGLLSSLTIVNIDNRNRVPGYPNEREGAGENGSVEFDVKFDYSGAYTASTHGLVPATNTSGTVAPGWLGYEQHQLDVIGAAVLRVVLPIEDVSSPDTDLDLYLLDPFNQIFAQSTGDGTDEVLEVISPIDGTWSVYVYGRPSDDVFDDDDDDNVNGPSSVDYGMYSWVVSATSGGNMFVIEAPDTAVIGETGAIDVNWTDASEGEWHLGAVSHSNETSIMALTFVNVDNRDLI